MKQNIWFVYKNHRTCFLTLSNSHSKPQNAAGRNAKAEVQVFVRIRQNEKNPKHTCQTPTDPNIYFSLKEVFII